MEAKKKVTYILYTNGTETPEDLQKKLIGRRIRVAAIMRDEKMAHWAKDLGVSRQFVFQVVDGSRKTTRIREYIENRLRQKFWNDENNTKSKKVAAF